MQRRTASWLVALAVAGTSLAGVQQQPTPTAVAKPEEFTVEYRRLVRNYIGGDSNRAVIELSTLPPTATQQLILRPDKPWNEKVNVIRPDKQWDLQMFLAAVMLETEAAFRSNRGDVLTDRVANAELWLKQAGHVFARAEWENFRRRWSLAVGRKVLWMAVLGPADGILAEACELFKDDAALHVAFGLARETTAHNAGATPALDRSAASYVRQRALSDARIAFERALRIDSESALSVEARVRLARVHVVLGDDRRATALLEQALSRNPADTYRYLSEIMLGDIEARRGRLEHATVRYLEARHVIPGAQNSFIAHAHALRAAGQHDTAATVLSEMLGRTQRVEDPWVQYPKGFDLERTNLEPLRTLVREMK